MKNAGRLLVFLMSVCLATVFAAEADPGGILVRRLGESRKPSVLFIGNSYSFHVPKLFRTYAANRGKAVKVGQVTHGGWTLARHAANEETLKRIREGRWDVVVLQEQSRIPSLPAARRASLMDPPLRKLADEVRKQGAIPVLYQTWGYREGDAKLRRDDFHAMTARVRGGYRAAAARAGNLVVVRVGDRWDDEASRGKLGDLFQEDGSHPSRLGDKLTARVFHETFFPRKR